MRPRAGGITYETSIVVPEVVNAIKFLGFAGAVVKLVFVRAIFLWGSPQ